MQFLATLFGAVVIAAAIALNALAGRYGVNISAPGEVHRVDRILGIVEICRPAQDETKRPRWCRTVAAD